MRIKRWISYFLCVAMIIGLLCGCVGKPGDQQSSSKTAKAVTISIDEWIGYWGALIANGGLKTKPGSINDRNGIYVEYVIMNDRIQSSSALASGKIHGAGYTVNSTAFLQNKFDEAGVDIVMPFITNYSNGADGIIAKADIKSVSDLVGKRIAYPRFSESQTLVEWLIQHSQLTAEEQKKIRDKMVPFDTPEETAKAFFSGDVDAAATWEPFLTDAKNSVEADVLFDTSMSTNLILSGFIFSKDFAEENEEFMVKWIDGMLEAAPLYKHDFDSIREMPLCQEMTEDEIKEMAEGADLTTAAQNEKLLTDTAIEMYREMAEIWNSLGEVAHPEKAEEVFTDKYVSQLLEKYPEEGNGEKTFDSEERKKMIESPDSLLEYKADIKFELNSAEIKKESYGELDDFVEVANVLDGVYIQIEGNASKRNDGVTEAEIKKFSEDRAKSIAKYFVKKGINSERIIVVGKGDSNPIDPENPAGAINRRTEIFFKAKLGF